MTDKKRKFVAFKGDWNSVRKQQEDLWNENEDRRIKLEKIKSRIDAHEEFVDSTGGLFPSEEIGDKNTMICEIRSIINGEGDDNAIK